MPTLQLLGLNHKTAPLAVRERVAFSPQQHQDALQKFRERFPGAELVLLPTCNRVELYISGEQISADQTREFIATFHGLSAEQLRPHLYHFADHSAAAHLFSVVCSLDSMVLGEHQILGQVKAAYETSLGLGLTSSTLNPLFQRALSVGKEVFNTTHLAEGRNSISGAAVQYAQRIFDRFSDKRVLCIGAGKMALLALRGFAGLKPRSLTVCNRDAGKARRIAGRFNGVGASLDDLQQQLIQADIVITSTGATSPLITRRQMVDLLPLRKYRRLFIIDIAVPRDVEASVGELDQVHLCDLDDLQAAIDQTQVGRSIAAGEARKIVDRSVDEFVAWQQQREMGPLIEQLQQRIHELADQEVERSIAAMPDTSPQQAQAMRDMARRMANQFLHEPIRALRDARHGHASPDRYLHAVEQLFKLNQGRDHGPAPADAE